MSGQILAPSSITPRERPGSLLPALGVRIQRAGRIAALFGSAAERRAFWLHGFQAAGNHFIAHYVPLRFQRGYASSRLGYRIGGLVPFVDSGETAENILTRARATAHMGQGGAGGYIMIRMMAGPKINRFPNVLRGLKTIIPSEVAILGKVAEAEWRRLAATASRTTIARGPTAGRLRLSLGTVGATADIAAARTRHAQVQRRLGLGRTTNTRPDLIASLRARTGRAFSP
jgi:hypothetical protein